MNKFFTGSHEQKKQALLISIAIAVVLMILFAGATRIFAQSSNIQLSSNDSLTVNCEGRGFQIERISRTNLSLTCTPSNVTVPPTQVPPTQVPPTQEPVPTMPPSAPSPPINNGNVLFYDGFENGRIPYEEPDFVWKPVGSNSSTVVSSPARIGEEAIRFEVDYPDFRSELRLARPNSVRNFDFGQEYWYGFSVYLPANYEVDYRGDTLNQFLSVQNDGEPYRAVNPAIAFRPKAENWNLLIRADSRLNWVKPDYETVESFNMGSWQEDVGQWTDWVYQIKWSYGEDGIVRVWKNGELVVDYQGPNTFNGFDENVRWKIGIYKTSWKSQATDVDRREIYYDEIRVGNQSASYDMVMPGSNMYPIGEQ